MNNFKKIIVKIILTSVLMLCILSCTVSAAIPFESYIYGDTDEIIYSSYAATPGDTFDGAYLGTTALNNPQDMFCDTKGFLYVVDTGNNRIIKLDKNYKVSKIYDGFKVKGKFDNFKEPSGIYVDEKGDIYIADTGNKRIVKLDSNGNYKSIYSIPKSDLLPNDFDYKPVKVVCDTSGRIFVASRGFNYGLIELDRNGEFVQMLGASEVTYTISEVIWRFLSTKEQRDRMAAFVPAEYNNISIDSDGFIFATTGTSASQPKDSTPVRKINAKGSDVLRREGTPVGDLQTTSVGSLKGQSMIVDVTNMSNGIYAILDQKRGRVFVYNQDGNMLFEFGGLGQVYGTFDSPTSLVYYNNNFLVLDGGKNAMISYSLTEYGQLFLEAENYKSLNQFEKEKETWHKILELNENNPLVLTEIGKICYRQRDMESALKYFELANDKHNYSRAFQFYRRELIKKYFAVGAICLASVIALYLIFKLVKKYYLDKKYPPKEKVGPWGYTKYVIFHPFDGFWDLKRERRGSLKVAITMLTLASLSFVIKTQFEGFIFQTKLPEEANFVMDLATLLIPIALWIASTWCVTSLMSGEGSFKDIVVSTGYSVSPIVFIVPIASILSNVLTQTEGAIYQLFVVVSIIWTVALLICSVKQTQNFSMGKALGVVLISLLVIIVIIFIVLLCTALIQQMVAFFSDICSELIIRAR